MWAHRAQRPLDGGHARAILLRADVHRAAAAQVDRGVPGGGGLSWGALLFMVWSGVPGLGPLRDVVHARGGTSSAGRAATRWTRPRSRSPTGRSSGSGPGALRSAIFSRRRTPTSSTPSFARSTDSWAPGPSLAAFLLLFIRACPPTHAQYEAVRGLAGVWAQSLAGGDRPWPTSPSPSNVVPVTGLPLPLVSLGGTSLVFSCPGHRDDPEREPRHRGRVPTSSARGGTAKGGTPNRGRPLIGHRRPTSILTGRRRHRRTQSTPALDPSRTRSDASGRTANSSSWAPRGRWRCVASPRPATASRPSPSWASTGASTSAT